MRQIYLRWLIVILCQWGCGGWVAADTRPVQEFSIARVDGSPVRYYLLTHSESSTADTLLLILQGSDCNSITHAGDLVDKLRQVSPAADVLLVEKYGIDKQLPYSRDPERSDCPEEYLTHDNPHQRVEDIRRVVETVKKGERLLAVYYPGGK